MTNKEKLEIIDKSLDKHYNTLGIVANADKEIISEDLARPLEKLTQSIYNLESTKLLLEPISNSPTIYECCNCGKQIECYGEFIKGECLKCGYALVKKGG